MLHNMQPLQESPSASPCHRWGELRQGLSELIPGDIGGGRAARLQCLHWGARLTGIFGAHSWRQRAPKNPVPGPFPGGSPELGPEALALPFAGCGKHCVSDVRTMANRWPNDGPDDGIPNRRPEPARVGLTLAGIVPR
jgi:hypothetical protein